MQDLVQAGATLILSAAGSYVIEKAIAPALEPLWALAKSVLFPRWDAAFSEVQRNVAEAFESARVGDAQFIERLHRSLRSGEGDALVTQFLRDAAQATTEDRMHMLASAAAGILTPNLEAEMRSRVTRAMEQLEPSDVVALRDASKARALDQNVQQLSTPDNASALLRTGCVSEASGVGYRTKYDVTPLGTAVLYALRMWTPPQQT